MSQTFETLFKSDNPARDKFIARLFGIFNEEIVRCWARDPNAPYEDLGRPTIKLKDTQERGRTLDFTLRSREDGHVYVSEMKCWLEYQNYRFLPLKGPGELVECDNPAFRLFLLAAKDPSQVTVTVNGKPQSIDGSILVWGKCSEEVVVTTKAAHNFNNILSLESMISDLVAWQNEQFEMLLRERREWASHLFDGLGEIRNTTCRVPHPSLREGGDVEFAQ